MADMPDVTQLPAPKGGNVNTPASGVYGEGAALERLKQALPAPQQPTDTPPQAGPMPTPNPGAGVSNAMGPGVPQSIMAPTQRPDVPVNTPLAAPIDPMAAAQSGRQRRLVVLDALENNPNTSDTTREWIRNFRRQLIENA